MRTEEIIIRLFCMVDDKLAHVNKRSNAHLYPSNLLTFMYLYSIMHTKFHKGGKELPISLLLVNLGGGYN